MRTHNPQYARSEYHTQLAKMSFDKIFDLTAGVYFHFYNTGNMYSAVVPKQGWYVPAGNTGTIS